MPDILELARECGAATVFGDGILFTPTQLEAFAQRIREDERETGQELRENAKLAWRALCDAEAVLRTIDPESATEGEELRALRERLTDCAMHLFTLLREPTSEWSTHKVVAAIRRGGDHG